HGNCDQFDRNQCGYANSGTSRRGGVVMTWFLVAVTVVSTALGEVSITRGMKQTGEIDDFRPGAWISSLGRAFLNPFLMFGVFGMAVAFFSFLILVSRTDLSFAVPATAATVVAQT